MQPSIKDRNKVNGLQPGGISLKSDNRHCKPELLIFYICRKQLIKRKIMARLLAIDYGSKRTGLAVTDPLQIIATALEAVPTHQLFSYLKDYLEKETVEAVVVGMPRRLDNTETNNTAGVLAFIAKFKKVYPGMPVHTHDERFTSSMALHSMIMSGTKKKDRREKGNIDKVSATIILQSFMESRH